MAELRTEEEQIEAIKSWWKSNGRSLVVGIVVAGAIVFGWRTWQDRQAVEAENASIQYQSLIQAVSALRANTNAEGQLQTTAHLVKTLKEDYSDSGYASLAALLMAGVYVDQHANDKALDELSWVIDSKDADAETKDLARIRSARILIAEDKLSDAQTQLSAVKSSTYDAISNELRGDLLAKQSKYAEARTAYDASLQTADAQARPIIEMKRDNLPVGE